MNTSCTKIFSDLLIDDDYCLLYNGNFVDAVTAKIINIAKVSLIQRGDLIKTQNRFSYFIAECFQNIIRHGGHKEHDFNVNPVPGFFMAKIRSNFYDLVTANLISNPEVEPLKKLLDDLNVMPDEELRALYKKVLSEGKMSEKGGAGVGIIDMARKSSQKMGYEFLSESNNQSMFYYRVVMSSNPTIKERDGSDNNIEFGIDLHKALIENNVLMLQKSDFSRNSIIPMLDIVEHNINGSEIGVELIKNTYQILIELIQMINLNEFRYDDEKEGVFLISKQNGSYQICSGNFINYGEKSYLNRFIEQITSGEITDLDRLYLSSLNEMKEKGVDIGKLIAERFEFIMEPIDDKALFLTIIANI